MLEIFKLLYYNLVWTIIKKGVVYNMTTRKINVSSQRYTFGFPGADFPNLESAEIMARHKYKEMKEKYGNLLKEGYDTALQYEDYALWLKLTLIIDD